MDHEVKKLKRSRIPIVKVRWNSKCGPEFTWEREDFMKAKYPKFFADRVDEKIMDHEVKKLKRSRIPIVKVRWNSKCGPEFTWEREDFMKAKYPKFFADRVDESAS
nr:putative reverse transcriptase domain-containing protein [Tanacetum cinerariifolium]